MGGLRPTFLGLTRTSTVQVPVVALTRTLTVRVAVMALALAVRVTAAGLTRTLTMTAFELLLSPDFRSGRGDQGELVPLLLLGEVVPLLG